MTGTVPAPDFDTLLAELKTIAGRGATRLRGQHVPVLRSVAVTLDLCEPSSAEPAPLVAVLRQAVERLDGGDALECAEWVLGLSPAMGFRTLAERRSEPARLLGVQVDTFRKNYEPQIIAQVAELVMELLHDQGMRRANVAMQARVSPVESRLAVQWVERFEAYYRIWTPIYALGSNLRAAIATYEYGPSERRPWDPDNPAPYDYEQSARLYASDALTNLAQYHLEVKRFISRHGGLWLASDRDTEEAIADAVYRVGWHNDLVDDDASILRRNLAQAQHEESGHFLAILTATSDGDRIHRQWQKYVHDGIGLDEDARSSSQVWSTIAACEDYVRLVDEDWDRIADWYKPTSTPRRHVDRGAELYAEHLTVRRCSENPRHPLERGSRRGFSADS